MKKQSLLCVALVLLLSSLTSLETYSQTGNFQVYPVNFNSTNDDFGTTFTRNGKTMFFTSERNSSSKQKIFSSSFNTDSWSSPDVLNSDINSGKQNGSVTLTPDGQYMIFAAFKHDVSGEGRTDLYSARKIRGDWDEIQNLGMVINSEYWDSQPCLTADGNTLYFVSDRPGGMGGTDIYTSTRTREGWTKPQNLGSSINSSSDEMSPFIGPDNTTFYYASNKSGGSGGFDIYISKLNNNSFSQPINAAPVNSAGNEYFYSASANSDVAYFSSDRPGGKGNLDIYTIVPNPYKFDGVVNVEGVVYDNNTRKPIGASIIVTDIKTKKKVAELRSDDIDGSYYVILQAGRTYSITVSKKDYMFYSERYEVPKNEKGHTEKKDIYLSPTDTRLLIFFDFNKFDLSDESFNDLDNLVGYLNEYPSVKISIEGHTDDVGEADYNKKLSLDRANSAKNYIVQNGIEKDRIKTAGYGEEKPLVNDKTDDARKQNRRVEVKVIK